MEGFYQVSATKDYTSAQYRQFSICLLHGSSESTLTLGLQTHSLLGQSMTTKDTPVRVDLLHHRPTRFCAVNLGWCGSRRTAFHSHCRRAFRRDSAYGNLSGIVALSYMPDLDRPRVDEPLQLGCYFTRLMLLYRARPMLKEAVKTCRPRGSPYRRLHPRNQGRRRPCLRPL